MKSNPPRTASARATPNRLSPRAGRFLPAPARFDPASQLEHRRSEKDYADLDSAYLSRRRHSTRQAVNGDHPRRRASVPVEGLLVPENSSAAFQSLPQITAPASPGAEESILKKWEAWSAQVGNQLALESAVPVAASGRSASRNSSFRGPSQVSDMAPVRQRPVPVRQNSPLRPPSRRSASCASTRSRQSSLASTVVEPFRVGDRMTASSERRRQRSHSTKKSRELLFRRALGLENDASPPAEDGSSWTPLSSSFTPAPLIQMQNTAAAANLRSEPRRPLVDDNEREKLSSLTAKSQTAERDYSAHKADDQERRKLLPSETPPSLEPASVAPSIPPPIAVAVADERAEKWLKRTAALLGAKDQPFPNGENRSAKTERSVAPVPSSDLSHNRLPKEREKWHLPLGEAAQMVCGRVTVRPMTGYSVPFIGYCDSASAQTVDVQDQQVSPAVETASTFLVWPIDRSDVNVLFVEHHVEDERPSVYVVEDPPRETVSSKVLPNWDESRRRFAPAPLEDSQAPQ